MLKRSFPNPLLPLASVWLAAVTTAVLGQAPVISSFSQNGQLVCTNLQPGSTASVEWASSPSGPWTNTWAGLASVTVDSNGALRVSVPMFYRVRGVPPPPGMALIPAGAFQMGDSLDGDSQALPLHIVQVSAFYMDQTEVSKGLWNEVYQWAITNGYSFDNAGSGKAATHPVQTVNWYDCLKWCNARSEKEGLTPAYYTTATQTAVYRDGHVDVLNEWVKWRAGYRLPTEAEWERAARGSIGGHRFPWSDSEMITHSRANYFSSTTYAFDNSPTRGFHPAFYDGVEPYTSPVGHFAANNFGLYDMAGNVWEWVWDWYDVYSIGSQTDPRGPESGTVRVRRGGRWANEANFCRVAARNVDSPSTRGINTGFRSVLPANNP